jgi:cobalt-zinc-cadmium efflux system membrane fusion protein
MYWFFKLKLITAGSIVFFIIFALISCRSDKPSVKQDPATVKNPVKETTLTTITLSESAEQRLGITTALVTYQKVSAIMKTAGEIIAVPGRNVQVTAPISGTVLYAINATNTLAGKRIKKGQEVMRLLLMPPEKDALNAREEVSVKEVEHKVALAKSQRAEQLYLDNAISEKSLHESQAALAVAQGQYNAAKARLALLSGQRPDSTVNTFSAMVLVSPFDGILQKILVAPGQTVPASTPLFEVASQNPLWVKTFVYSGNLSKIDKKENATISLLGENNNDMVISVKPVQGPPLSNAGIVASDLYYELPNEQGNFRIGQKVMVFLPQSTTEEKYVIPFSSLIYDLHGGSWVYIKISAQTYSRHRVEVSHRQENNAILSRGVRTGDEVAVTGVAELYGIEFGGGK